MESLLILQGKIEINLKLCILCQKRKNVNKDDRLVESTKHGLEVLEASFIKRMELANELGEKDERIERLTEIYQTDHNVEFSWHKQCYGHFTDNSKVKRLEEKVKKE